MVRKLEVEDIVKILKLDDLDIEEFFPCEKGEFVQWLISQADNPHIFIWGGVDDINDLSGLIVVMNGVFKPISDVVSILYFKPSDDVEVNKELVYQLNIWAKEKKASKVIFNCKNIEIFHEYGATQQGILGGWSL